MICLVSNQKVQPDIRAIYVGVHVVQSSNPGYGNSGMIMVLLAQACFNNWGYGYFSNCVHCDDKADPHCPHPEAVLGPMGNTRIGRFDVSMHACLHASTIKL